MAILRVAFAIEFLAALIATFTLWSQVGGQGHLDMMPWYWKLIFGVAVSFSAVKATAAAAVEKERAWNPRTWKWLILTVFLLGACGLVTYYYHLNEPPEEDEEEEVQQTLADDYRDWRGFHSTSRIGPITNRYIAEPVSSTAASTTNARKNVPVRSTTTPVIHGAVTPARFPTPF